MIKPTFDERILASDEALRSAIQDISGRSRAAQHTVCRLQHILFHPDHPYPPDIVQDGHQCLRVHTVGHPGHGIQGAGREQRILLCHPDDRQVRRIAHPADSRTLPGHHDRTQDIVLFRVIRSDDSAQDRHCQGHKNPGIQQNDAPSARILLPGKERRHHSQDERRCRGGGIFHHQFTRHADKEPDTHPVLLRHTHIHELAADAFHPGRSTSYGVGNERDRKETEKGIPGSPEQMERYHVTAGRDPERTAHHQGFHCGRKDDGQIHQSQQRTAQCIQKSSDQAGPRPSGKRISRNSHDHDSSLVRRHADIERSLPYRCAYVHFLHGDIIQCPQPSERIRQSRIQHPERPGIHGKGGQDTEGREQHQGKTGCTGYQIL